MQGLVFSGREVVRLERFDDPTPGPDEVVLEIRASGLCGTDLKTYRAPEGSPFIGGHEPCGVVVARGVDVPECWHAGARVMVHHYDGCRSCDQCASGWTQLCETGSTVYGRTEHGAHARYMKVPAHTLVALPDALSFAEGAAISCGTGTAFGAFERMQIRPGATIAIVGQGPVGLSATMIGAAMGLRVIAVDVDAGRLAQAMRFGAAERVDSRAVPMVDAIRDLTRGLGAEYVMECSGNGDATGEALAATRIWGTLCLVGLGAEATVQTGPQIVLRQITVMGSWTFSKAGQAACATFCAERALPVESLFTHRFALEDGAEAYRRFASRETGKVLIAPT